MKICTVSKDEVNAKDLTLIRRAIEEELDTLKQVFSEEIPEDQLSAYAGKVSSATSIKLTIHGYDADPKPLWAFPETREWAWQLLKKMPFSIAFLEPQSCLLVGLLCLGGYESSKYGGYIPDFRAERSEEFFAFIEKSMESLLSKYENLPEGVYLQISVKSSSISTQFEEMKQSLEKQGRCFIATAVYGSASTYEVKVLRHFRDSVLIKNSWGELLMRFYYSVAPAMAPFIMRRKQLRRLVRFLIDSVVQMVASKYHRRTKV